MSSLRRSRAARLALPVATLLSALLAAPTLLSTEATPARAQDATVVPPAAVWPLGERTAGTAYDWVGGRDGTTSGGVTAGHVAQGPTTTSTRFDGTGAITAAATGLAADLPAVTAWVRPSASATSGTVVDTGGMRLLVSGGRPALTTCTPSGGCGTVVAPERLGDGAWHSLAGSVGGGTRTLFVDGVAVAATATGSDTAPPRADAIRIGAGLHGDVDRVAVYAAPLTPETVDTEFRRGACPQGVGAPVPPTAGRSVPALPLHTSGRFVVDAHGKRVKLAAVNWYGAEELDRAPAGLQCESVDAIASRIAADGFNVVRLPWSTDTWVGNPPAVPPVAVAANPQLRGRDARAVFDAVVAALARHGLMVVLDNHVSRADWCCSREDGNGLWWQGYDPAHPPAWRSMTTRARTAYFRRMQNRWLSAWRTVAGRYAHVPAVVGADLRNEPRSDALLDIPARWGGSRVPVWSDWPRAATTAGDLLLRIDPRLLVVVEGTSYATNLRGVASRPIRLSRAHRLVYSAHDYSFTHPGLRSATQLREQLGSRWGWLLTQHRWWTTPVWVGEFGTCHPEEGDCGAATWWPAFVRYLRDGDIDWAYWSFNGTGARGRAAPTTCAETLRFPGCPESYGLSSQDWATGASRRLSATLRSIATATQGP